MFGVRDNRQDMIFLEAGKAGYKGLVLRGMNSARKTVGRCFVVEKKTSASKTIPGEHRERPLPAADAIVLGRELAVVKHMELPSQDHEELTEMIALQASRLTPFPKDEIIVDHLVSGLPRPHHAQVVVAAVPVEAVTQSLALRPDRKKAFSVVLSSECLCNWHRVLCEHLQDDTYAVIYPTDGTVELLVCSSGKLLFSKFLPFDARTLTGRVLEDFALECREALAVYEREQLGPRVRKAVIWSEVIPDNQLQPIVERLKGSLKDIDLKTWSAEQAFSALIPLGFKIEEDARAAMERAAGAGSSFAALLGLALDIEAPKMNFIPLALKEKARAARKIARFTPTAVILGLIIAMAVGSPFIKLLVKGQRLRSLDRQLGHLQSQTKDLDKVSKQLKLVGEFKRSMGVGSEILREIYRITPDKVYLSAVNFEAGERVAVRGTAISMADAFAFMELLKKRRLLADVKMKYINKRKIKNEDFADFEIIAVYETQSARPRR